MNPFYKMIRNLIAEENSSGHFSFKIADPTAVGENPVRELSLDVVPVDETSSIISLAWKDSAEKILEKTTSTDEASHLAQLISTDLAQVVKLTDEDNYDEAKDVMKNVLKTYLETTDTPIATNMPNLHNTQASVEKQAAVIPEAVKREIKNDISNSMYRMNAPGAKWYRFSLDGNKIYRGEYNWDEDFGPYQFIYNMETGEYKENPSYEATAYASKDADNLLKQAKITMQNLWFSTTDELMDYQAKQKAAGKPETDQDHIPLWDKNKKAPAAKDQLAPASLSYEDVENQKEQEHEDMQKHIDEKIKTELESALQEKAASVFGPDQVELVKVLKKNGRNWDEIKKILIKDFGFDKDATTIFVDEQRQGSDPAGIEVEPIKEEEKPLTPPEELVSPETHEKLLKDHEDKKKEISPVKEPGFSPKEVMDIPEDDEIKDESSQHEKCSSCGHMKPVKGECPSCKRCDCEQGHASSLDNEIARADNDEIHKVAADNPLTEPIQEKPTSSVPQQDKVPFGQSSDHRTPKPESWVIVKSDLKGELPSFRGKFISEKTEIDGSKWGIVDKDGELLQVEMNRIIPESEGAQEAEPAMAPEIATTKEEDIPVTPSLDSLHSASSLKEADEDADERRFERAVNILDKKMMSGDIHQEEYDAAYEALKKQMFPNEIDPNKHLYAAKSTKCIKCDKELPVEKMVSNEHGAGYLCKEHAAEWNKDASQDDLLSIKAEAEQLLKDVNSMGKTSYQFIKKGLEKHANDSAFEGNGWVRVWVQEDEVASSSKYPEILKMPDEAARIQALKELAREIAHEALSLADSSAAKVGVQNYIESLSPSDHDRIDWVALASPVNEEEEDAKFEQGMADKYGPDAAIPPQAKSSLEPKVEKKADVMDTKCEECGKPLGPEAFLSKWPVCGDCTRKRHKKVTGSGAEDVMRGQAGDRGIGKIWVKDNYDGSTVTMSSHFGSKEEFDKWAASKVAGSTTREIVRSEFPLAAPKKASDFEKGISQNKTADEPVVEPKTVLKDVKITPDYVEKEKASPATDEQAQIISKIKAIETNLDTLDRAKEEMKAKLKAELQKIDDAAERSTMEREYQEQVEKLGILIKATQNQLIKSGNEFYSYQNQEVKVVPDISKKEWLEKFKKRFEGAEKFINDVKHGMMALAKSVMTPTITRWPEKRSELIKEASISEQLAQMNAEMLEALKLLSQPL